MNHKGHCTYGLIPQKLTSRSCRSPMSMLSFLGDVPRYSSPVLQGFDSFPIQPGYAGKKTESRLPCGSLYGPESATHHFFIHSMSCNSATGQTPLQDQREIACTYCQEWPAGLRDLYLTPPASTQHAFTETGKEDTLLQGLPSLDVYDMDAPEISLFYGAEP